MSSSPAILAVITARGGSKGLPGKNIKVLMGRPLIAHTIDAARNSRLLTHTIVSTDDPDIARVAKEWGGAVPFMRPAELARDTTPHLPVMQHAVSFMEEAIGAPFEYVVILQPTSPFRTAEDIDGTVQKLIETGADSAVSIVQVSSGEHPIKMKKLEGDRVLHYAIPEPEGTRRQEFPPAYKRSGAVYAMKRNTLMKEGKLYGAHVAGYVVPKERSIDIDDEFDWIRAEYMVKKMEARGESV
ncbi:MAG: hypothetical protein A3I44_03680 [Candidatus Sungbacteria bacterium RIFCSPLOWO2_02_FULL_51_17]|uniref:N-acylneuraminate cytidylyltransferase n=1 Tax=Candidatus Sungbacteria bacterium RIFCSPHIGHO2_02_FULL_51_29 TaxID=1802273 RepID=A0A1G2KR25_9BACT|nr:MAG: hypothetical protein A2676_03460 [Candidatus Sungbacteria bacterium RIFCSPHIGHO2_01_FULL_51_22]OHA01813.1 MAG: hypothetical protein A3C16_05865 [Candidatus Sungbacteria bacterium RIFCSPHIGHO2_02_FULL_51_29]OHA07192.1 MAG: hypothetical protein A3B29_00435 [Candidatus Sungbacteria bacterium RIFCSPLOWO2_01_FULL_51_34]OHA10488.1 MAG: hypothetical protein A3I44_03680 [Candidatus Sungbacteria bacterium RIFCSPLOWO2_02_FULL_51_17]